MFSFRKLARTALILLAAGLVLLGVREARWQRQAARAEAIWRGYSDSECEALCEVAARMTTRIAGSPYWKTWYRWQYGVMRLPPEFQEFKAKRVDVVPTAVVVTWARWGQRSAVLTFLKNGQGEWTMEGEIGSSPHRRIHIWPRPLKER